MPADVKPRMSTSTSRGSVPTSSGLSTVLWPVRAAAFWAAIVLPFLSVALVATGVATDSPTLGSLLAANVAALLVGHGYGR
jgi:hypothetical protein